MSYSRIVCHRNNPLGIWVRDALLAANAGFSKLNHASFNSFEHFCNVWIRTYGQKKRSLKVAEPPQLKFLKIQMYGIAKLLTQDRNLMAITITIDELTAPVYPQEVRVKKP
jgi:hypothetical protein